jgi:uroporphyrinogen-III decarboxylase
LRQVDNVKRSSPYLIVSATEEYLIKTRADFDLFARYAPVTETLDCSLVRRARAAVGDQGLVASFVQGVFCALGFLRRLDDALMDPLTDAGWYRAMMEYLVDRITHQNRVIVAAGGEVLEFGGNMATGTVGPRFFQAHVLPYEQRVIRAAHEAGAYTIYHNCGDAARIMNLYNDLGVDCWGYLTPPPFGDVDLDEALRVMRPDLVLRGNVDQVEFLVKASPMEIRERVREVLEKVRPRGHFILSATDFFSDGTPPENLHAFAEAGREFGCD